MDGLHGQSNDNNEVSLSSETSRTGNQSLKIFGRTKDFHSAKYNISQLDVGSSYSLFIYAKLPEENLNSTTHVEKNC